MTERQEGDGWKMTMTSDLERCTFWTWSASGGRQQAEDPFNSASRVILERIGRRDAAFPENVNIHLAVRNQMRLALKQIDK